MIYVSRDENVGLKNRARGRTVHERGMRKGGKTGKSRTVSVTCRCIKRNDEKRSPSIFSPFLLDGLCPF